MKLFVTRFALCVGLTFHASLPVASGAGKVRAEPSGAAKAAPLRIVSLAPNLTEIVFALGAEDSLVGITAQCDFPEAAKSKERVGGFTDPNLERILKLRPSHVLATEGNPRPLLEKLQEKGIDVVEFHAREAGSLPAQLRALAARLLQKESGETLAVSIEKALARLDSTPKARGSVLLALQFEPIYAVSAGTWLGDLFARAHFENIVPKGPQPYPVVSLELMLARKPDYLVVFSDSAPESSAAPVLGPARALLDRKFAPGKPRPKLVVSPESMLMRPGPRLVQAIEFLAADPVWRRD